MYHITMRSPSPDNTQEKYLYHDGFIDPKDKVLKPTLEYDDNKAGSVEFTVPPTHPYYDNVTDELFRSTVYVYQDKENIWQGRLLSSEKDFYGNKKVYVEGAMSYFNDTYQLNATYTNCTLSEFIGHILDVHNGVGTSHEVPDDRKIYKGTVEDVLDPVDPDATTITPKREDRFTSYERTMDALENLIDQFGGHMYITIDNSPSSSHKGRPILNYELKRLDRPLDISNNQVINFGDNLLDYVETQDYTEFASVLIPLGDSVDSSDENYSEYVTLKDYSGSVPEGFSIISGTPYLKKTEEFNKFGFVCREERWDNVTTQAELMKEAVRFMKDLQNTLITLSVKAVDLHYLDTNISAFSFLSVVNVVSVPHRINKNFLVTKLKIEMDNPANSEIELGAVVAEPISTTVAKNSASNKYSITKGGNITVMSAADVENATPIS